MINTVSTLPLKNHPHNRCFKIHYPPCCGEDVEITKEIQGVVKRWQTSMESQEGLPRLTYRESQEGLPRLTYRWDPSSYLIVTITKENLQAPQTLSMNDDRGPSNMMKEAAISTIEVFYLIETRKIGLETVTDSLRIEGTRSGCTMTFCASKDKSEAPTFSYKVYKPYVE